MKERSVDWAISVADQGGSWWMPLVLFCVVTTNSLTGGTLMWCIGVLQAVLYPMVVIGNKKYGIILGPLVMTLGSSIAAITYIRLMQSSGADALLEMSGAKNSKWLDKTTEWA